MIQIKQINCNGIPTDAQLQTANITEENVLIICNLNNDTNNLSNAESLYVTVKQGAAIKAVPLNSFLNFKQLNPAADNLDNQITPGIYTWMSPAAQDISARKYPNTGGSTMVVFPGNFSLNPGSNVAGYTCIQLAINYEDLGKCAFRGRTSTKWTDWRNVATLNSTGVLPISLGGTNAINGETALTNLGLTNSDGHILGSFAQTQDSYEVNETTKVLINESDTGSIIKTAFRNIITRIKKLGFASKGSSNSPVYFDADGEPQVCSGPLDISITGNAATATTAQTANTATTATSAETATTAQTATSAETANIANVAHNAATANTATTATKLGTATVGSASKPVYLDAGTPKACNVFLDVGITGNAATATTATTATKLGTGIVGATNQLIYLDGGTPTQGIQILAGTSTPPTDSDIPNGSIYIKYN